MTLTSAKVLYWRCTLASLNVERAWEMDEYILEPVLNARSLVSVVGFEQWLIRCKIEIDAPTQEVIEAAKDQHNKAALGGLMAAFAGNTPPPLEAGQRPHVPIVSTENIPAQKPDPLAGMQAQGTKDPGQK